MILTLALPQINPDMTSAVVQVLYAPTGEILLPGAKILDLKVDLSVAVAHDCPPISFHRITLRDRGWLRRLTVSVGEEIPVGTLLALFSTEPEEDIDIAPTRSVRISIAGILYQPDWWN